MKNFLRIINMKHQKSDCEYKDLLRYQDGKDMWFNEDQICPECIEKI